MTSQTETMAVPPSNTPRLDVLDLSKPHTFIKPIKRINEGTDVSHFLISHAYRDICLFVLQLNHSMCPRIVTENGVTHFKPFKLGDDTKVEGLVEKIQSMLKLIEKLIDEVPPDTGPRRFGNISFRRWHELLESRIASILREFVPHEILDAGTGGEATAEDELVSYLMGSFGSGLRLDFGTGHELSFLAFLGCLWKMGGFTGKSIPSDGSVERSIVLGLFEPYLNVIRKLVLTYTLEPAGSHGVWGLDDHFFLSYIFGSAQYCPAIKDTDPMPTENSLLGAPSPADVTRKATVELERKTNMYFSAIGFIYDVKTGPFWEHSPILFDISGIKSGWGKVNKGMIKMYNAEVLSKFPVVQHFYFGSLFSWDKDPDAKNVPATVHMTNQPHATGISVTGDTSGAPMARQPGMTVTAPNTGMPMTTAPWATGASSQAMPMTTAPWASGHANQAVPMTAAPWARPDPRTGGAGPDQVAALAPWAQSGSAAPQQQRSSGMPPTRAPWAPGGPKQSGPPR